MDHVLILQMFDYADSNNPLRCYTSHGHHCSFLSVHFCRYRQKSTRYKIRTCDRAKYICTVFFRPANLGVRHMHGHIPTLGAALILSSRSLG